jgi:hypothetical protein
LTGRLPGALAAPALRAVFSLIPEGIPSEMRLAALEAAARALLGQVRWGEAAEEGDWEAVEEEGIRWVFREGSLVSLGPGGVGSARSLMLTGPERSFAVTWKATGEWVAGPPGGESWARLASGQVVPETELLRHLEEGLDRLEDKFQAAEEASLSDTIPSDPTAPPCPLDEIVGGGPGDLGEAGRIGGAGLAGLSAGSLLAGAARVVGQVAASRAAARDRQPEPEGLSPRGGTPEPAAITCPRCGQPAVPGARFCKACGAPLRVASCSECQVALPAGARFCKNCGRPVRPGPGS